MENPHVTMCKHLKYNEVNILPWHLSNQSNPDTLYGCVGGEVVKMEYLEIYDRNIPEDAEALDSLCKDLFGMCFDLMLAIWHKRRPDLPLDIWYKVKMHLQ